MTAAIMNNRMNRTPLAIATFALLAGCGRRSWRVYGCHASEDRIVARSGGETGGSRGGFPGGADA
jgi:hypothetical protein